MSFRRVLYIVFPSILLTSCWLEENCKKIDVSEEDKSWFTQYKKGQLFIYKNTENQFDTLVVSEVWNSYSVCNRFELGDYQMRTVGITMDIINREIPGVSIIKETGAKVPEISVKIWANRDSTTTKRFGIMDLDYYSDSSLSNTVSYQNQSSNPKLYGGYLQSFVWKKDSGLVSYTTLDSITYKLVKIQ